MILHPGVLALISGSGITVVLVFFAAVLGLKILRKWDLNSNSEEQLRLERRTYLVSTLVQYGLFFEIISLFLFIYTADDIHNLLVGAMCATGSLNANAYGFPALYAGIAVVFLSAGWIALNYLDNMAPDYPLTRKKYGFLLFIVPVISASFILQLKYFLGLEPNVITSCCGVLFSEGGQGAGNSLASLPVVRTMEVFYSMFILVSLLGIAAAMTGKKFLYSVFSAGAALFFLVSIASVISFVSLYFYQIPTHHCPFDILQSEYYYAGYPLYGSLFTGSFFGIMAGLISPFGRITSLSAVTPQIQRKWTLTSVCATAIFVLITLVPILFSSFTLKGY